MTLVYTIAQAILVLALLLTLARLLVGPTISDRVVALDLLAITIVGIIAVWVLISGEIVFLDAAILIGLLGFIGSVTFARYIERGLLATSTPRNRDKRGSAKEVNDGHGP